MKLLLVRSPAFFFNVHAEICLELPRAVDILGILLS